MREEWIGDIDSDYRPVDVAILYGLGQTDRAQLIARKLRPKVAVLEVEE